LVRGGHTAPVVTYAYDVFGELRGQSGVPDDVMLFTGEQYDAKARRFNAGDPGLYYLRARYYDPTIGRFLSQDPLPGGNLYAYVGGNPTNFSDPSGLCLWGAPCPPLPPPPPIGDIVDCAANPIDCAETIVGRAVEPARGPFSTIVNYKPQLFWYSSSTMRTYHASLPSASQTASVASDFLSRFVTWECASFGLDLGGSIALRVGGPYGVPVAAGLFAGSLAISAKEGDFGGAGLDTVTEVTTPFKFAEYSPVLQGIYKKASGAAVAYSAVSCADSAFR